LARKSPLDDPEKAAFAWARYKKLMRAMLGVTVLTVLIAWAAIAWSELPVSPHFFIAAALGIGFTMMLASALMGLIFLSNGTGHDESIHDPREDADRWYDSDKRGSKD
jgi:hypothetical protein|tara:strand:- start:31183 stop:31506 length:324 start_codon:yes stop_codon:yes gene_type:complete